MLSRLTVLQNNQLTDELEYQSRQTEKLLSKNQKLEESVSVLKRDVEIHKKVELELAQKSQKAQNEINAMAKRVKEAEKSKEELAKEHKESQAEYQEENNEHMDEQVFGFEKRLNQMHKEVLELKRKNERLDAESARISARNNILHENEHPCLAMLLESLAALERGSRVDTFSPDLIEALRFGGAKPEL